MLKIRAPQVQRFRDVRVAEFESEMAEHLKVFAPKHCSVLKEEGVSELVRDGIAKAEQCGFDRRGPMRLFLEAMMTLGGRFYEDPIFSGMFEGVFTDGDTAGQMRRANQLFEFLDGYIAEVLGREREHARNALKGLRQMAAADVPVTGDLILVLLERVRYVFPQKWDYLGEARHRAMLEAAIERAERFGARARRGQAFWGVMGLVAGVGFDDDSMYPWVNRTLGKASLGSPDERLARLEKRALVYLDAVIDGFESG